MHDALVKTMPGKIMTGSLAESWTVSADQKVYDFKLREGLTFHNGDPFTAEDDVWPSGVGPRVAEPALMLIDPYQWAAPYEEIRLKK
jgi:hypothetical protein